MSSQYSFLVGRDGPKIPPEFGAEVTERLSVWPTLKDKNLWIVSYGFLAGFAVKMGLTAILGRLLDSLDFPPQARVREADGKMIENPMAGKTLQLWIILVDIVLSP